MAAKGRYVRETVFIGKLENALKLGRAMQDDGIHEIDPEYLDTLLEHLDLAIKKMRFTD